MSVIQNFSYWPIYVISLKDSIDRRRSIAKQFDYFSLKFSFFEAVDGRAVLPQQYEGWVDRRKTIDRLGREMSDGEYACAISHMEVYKKILSDHNDGAIVLEDDAILTPLFVDFLRYSGYLAAPLIQLDHRAGFVSRFAKNLKIGDAILLRSASLNPQLTTAYSINSKAAKYLLERGLPLSGTADWPCDITPLPVYLASPRVVIHPEDTVGNSTLTEQRSRKQIKSRNKWIRFFEFSYWKRWFIKRVESKRIS